MLQSNPSVYPYTPFKHRQHDRISFENLQRLLQRQPLPNVHPRGETLAEHILSIFLDPEVYFGPVEFIGEQRTELLNNIQKRIAANQPILFSILGYPFKAPVPLKTRRRDPDLGEALSLQRLFHICLLIEKIYPPGARITIFTEEVFGTFVGATKEHCAHYASGVKMFVQRLGFSRRVTLCPLRKAEEHPLFTKCFTETLYTLEQRYQKRIKRSPRKLMVLIRRSFVSFQRKILIQISFTKCMTTISP